MSEATSQDPNTHVIVGAGLAGGLSALALADAGRGAGVVLLEQGARLGGNHTWSFHETDLGEDERSLIVPLVSWRWPRQTVKFPGRARTLETGYMTVTSERFNEVAHARLIAGGVRVMLERQVAQVTATRVRLDDGTVLDAPIVLDARGPEPMSAPEPRGFQKFLGLEVELTENGPWSVPLVMDADVPQLDGYRFVYVLPFSRRHVLVEDTMYSDGAALDVEALEQRIVAYIEAHGATVKRVLRRETGVLPLPYGHQEPIVSDDTRPLRVGYRGAFFHPVTGYSLPIATRVARIVAQAPSRAELAAALDGLTRGLTTQRRFERLLNRLMFSAMPGATRWRALERFYRLPDATIARFYASRNTPWDRARLLVGRPPRGLSWRGLFGLAQGETGAGA